MQNGEKERYITIGRAANMLGLDPQTVRKMVDSQKIAGFKTPSGQRRVDKHDILRFCNNLLPDQEIQKCERQNFLYARVSTKKQLGDLSRQVEYIKKPEYSEYCIIQDIGSGINFKRKGLSTLLDSCVQGTIGEIVVAHRDRLSRFGFDLIELFVSKAGGKITVLENNKITTSEIELAEDLMSIVHIYSCRQMGKRSYSKKEGNNCGGKRERTEIIENSQNKDLSNCGTKNID